MATAQLSDIDLERGVHRRRGYQNQSQHHLSRHSDTETEEEEDKDDESVCFSDPDEEEEEDDDNESTYSSHYSMFYSTTGGSMSGRRLSSASEMSVMMGDEDEDDDDGCGSDGEFIVLAERNCRICDLSLVWERHGDDDEEEEEEEEGVGGVPIELGCRCKGDLGVAHKHCAEAWFKIKGNKICEICNSTAKNVSEYYPHNPNASSATESSPAAAAALTVSSLAAAEAAAPSDNNNNNNNNNTQQQQHQHQQQRFWQGHRFLNFLLGCVVFAFVISWLFHFKIPSS